MGEFPDGCMRMDTERKSSQFPVIPTPMRSSTGLVLIPQTPYTPATKQGGWVMQPPIEFGGIKLTDAINPMHPGAHGYDDKVLNYEGVKNSIMCRLNVRRASKRPDVSSHVFFLSKFSGRDIGASKVRPTSRRPADIFISTIIRS